MGPSSYKTYLAGQYFKGFNKIDINKIYLNQKTSIEELLGGPLFLSKNFSKNYYFDLLYEIIEHDFDNYNQAKKKIIEEKNEDEIKIIKKEIEQRKGEGIVYNMINNLYKNLYDSINNNNKKPQITFKPGSILLNILKNEPFILKNIHLVSTEVFERFNELFGSERILSLNEDIYGTFFLENENKIIKLNDVKSVQIIATCPENSFQSLSESVLSRFTIICVRKHGENEKEKIIEKYSKKCYSMSSNCLNKIKNLFHRGEITDIKKIKNLINILSIMNQNNLKKNGDDKRKNQN